MKINGWQRLGIIASVFWILGAGIRTFTVVEDDLIQTAIGFTLQCEEAPDGSMRGSAKCDELSTDYLAKTTYVPWIEAAVVAFVPVPLGWGFTYLVLFLVRWTKRGFVKRGTTKTDET
jgi:hypothetical protein